MTHNATPVASGFHTVATAGNMSFIDTGAVRKLTWTQLSEPLHEGWQSAAATADGITPRCLVFHAIAIRRCISFQSRCLRLCLAKLFMST